MVVDDEDAVPEPEMPDDLRSMLDAVEEPVDVVNVTELDDSKLIRLFSDVRNELFKLGEMMAPKTDRGRELHSLRTACLLETQRRGLR